MEKLKEDEDNDPFSIMMKDVDDDWLEFLIRYKIFDLIKLTLSQILNEYNNDDITPDIENIMNWAKFPLNDIKIIICAQDPYYNVDEEGKKVANGLAFSTSSLYKCPQSLKQIFHAIKRDKFINEIPEKYDLSNWSRQGVLLLNSSHTTMLETANVHTKLWKSTNDKIFKYMSEYFEEQNISLIYMLWGKNAQKNICFINSSFHTIYKTAHPSPRAQSNIKDIKFKFTNCRHFKKANLLLKKRGDKEIIWDPVITHVIYTDGSCKLKPNGKVDKGFKANKDSVAAWAFYVSFGPFEGENDSGLIKTKKVKKIVNCDEDEDEKTKTITYIAYPNSIRAEGIALIKALGYVCNNSLNFTGIIIVKTDCKHWHDAFNLWKWMNPTTSHIKHQNLDIIQKLMELTTFIDEKIGELIIKYIPAAHNIDEPEDDHTEEYRDWLFNTKVDEMAKTARNN